MKKYKTFLIGLILFTISLLSQFLSIDSQKNNDDTLIAYTQKLSVGTKCK